ALPILIGQIGLAALATACGFLAFAPTRFTGVAELGIIAGAGMLIALLCTLTILPALLTLLAGEGAQRHRWPRVGCGVCSRYGSMRTRCTPNAPTARRCGR